MRSRHYRLSLVTLRFPSNGKRCIFRSRTMFFGAVAAVLHYNFFIGIVAELLTKIFGIPILIFFGDFGSWAPGPLARRALEVPDAFFELLGIRLKPGKSDVAPHVTFLGVRGSFPCAANGAELHTSLPVEKAPAWAIGIRPFRERGPIRSLDLEILIAILIFSQTRLFGKFARAQMSRFYKKIRRRVYVDRFSARVLVALRWCEVITSDLPALISRGVQRFQNWVLFTDAATKNNLFAAVLPTESPLVVRLFRFPRWVMFPVPGYPTSIGGIKYKDRSPSSPLLPYGSSHACSQEAA